MRISLGKCQIFVVDKFIVRHGCLDRVGPANTNKTEKLMPNRQCRSKLMATRKNFAMGDVDLPALLSGVGIRLPELRSIYNHNVKSHAYFSLKKIFVRKKPTKTFTVVR